MSDRDASQFERRLALTVVAAVTAVLILAAFWYGIELLLLVLTGVLIAVFLDALAKIVARGLRLEHGTSLVVVIVALTVATVLVCWLAFPSITRELAGVRDALQQSVDRLKDALAQWSLVPTGGTEGAAPRHVSVIVDRLMSSLSLTAGALAGALVAVAMGVYLAAQPELYFEGMLRLVPLARRARTREIGLQTARALRRWLVGKALTMTIIGISTTIGLYLVGLPLALVLGLIAGVLSFIPNIGPTLAAIPGVLIGLTFSVEMALRALAVYLVTQAIETYAIAPIVDRKTVSVPPALSLVMLLFMGLIGGGLGVMLSGPVAAALLVIVRMRYIEDVLGDDGTPT